MDGENIAFRQNNAAYYRSVIQAHPLFSAWPTEVISQFAKLWTVVNFEAGQRIVTEGMLVDNIYFIVEGNTEVITHDKLDPTKTHTLAVLSAGESIGLSATGLFSKTSERTATVVALSKVLAITIRLKTLQTFLQQHPNLNADFVNAVDRVFKMQLAKESIPFTRLSTQKLIEIADKIDEIDVPAETVLIKEGDVADNCYLIGNGKVEVSKQGSVVAVLSQPAIFGEMAIVLNEPRNAMVKTLTDCKLYRLHREELAKLYADEQSFARTLSTLVIKRAYPEQIADVIDRHELNADQSHKIVLKNIKSKQLYNLNVRSFFAWSLMDGVNSIDDISYLMKEKYGEDVTDELVELISDLYDNDFIQIRGYRFPHRKNKQESLWARLLNSIK